MFDLPMVQFTFCILIQQKASVFAHNCVKVFFIG